MVRGICWRGCGILRARASGAILWTAFYCLSLWIALPFGILLGESWKERLLSWLAFSGAAILLERRATSKNEEKPALIISEDKGEPECAVVETEHK